MTKGLLGDAYAEVKRLRTKTWSAAGGLSRRNACSETRAEVKRLRAQRRAGRKRRRAE